MRREVSKSNGAANPNLANDAILIEMAKGLILPANQQGIAVLQEVFELLDAPNKKRILEWMRVKTMASLRQQRTILEEAMRRYGDD